MQHLFACSCTTMCFQNALTIYFSHSTMFVYYSILNNRGLGKEKHFLIGLYVLNRDYHYMNKTLLLFSILISCSIFFLKKNFLPLLIKYRWAWCWTLIKSFVMDWVCIPCRPYNGNVKVFDIYLNPFWNFKLSFEKWKNGEVHTKHRKF